MRCDLAVEGTAAVVMEVVETALEELAMAEVDWMAEGWETEPGKAVALASDDSAAVVAVTAAADLVSVVQAMAVEMVREKAEVMVAVEIVVVVMALVGVAAAVEDETVVVTAVVVRVEVVKAAVEKEQVAKVAAVMEAAEMALAEMDQAAGMAAGMGAERAAKETAVAKEADATSEATAGRIKWRRQRRWGWWSGQQRGWRLYWRCGRWRQR